MDLFKQKALEITYEIQNNQLNPKDQTDLIAEALKFSYQQALKLASHIARTHFKFENDQDRLDGSDREHAIEIACFQIYQKIQGRMEG